MRLLFLVLFLPFFHVSGREMKPKSSPKLASSSAHAQSRSLDTLLELELVWNRQRGGKGSLRVREVVDALAGAQSQVKTVVVLSFSPIFVTELLPIFRVPV